MSVFELREYQTECLDSILRALLGRQRGTGVGRITRGAVVLPTGTGKTVIFSELARRWTKHEDWRMEGRAWSHRVLILVHRDELAEQARNKIHSADPSLTVGIVKAAQNDVGANVIVGSVQTLANPKRLAQLVDIGLVIVDECHHANAASYLKVLETLGCFEPDPIRATPCIGFTATLVRADKLKPGDVWEEVVFTRDIVWAIRNGFLVDVKGKRVQVKGLDLSRVRRLAGDLKADELADELLDADAPEQLAAAYLEHASDRIGIVFWPNKAAAEAGYKAFESAGIRSGLVLGETPKDERQVIYAGMWTGEVQTMHNVNVGTEGLDIPPISCVVPARLTQSAGLYMQMIGRGTRPHRAALPDPFAPKTDCLVLDPVGVTGRHKLATLADTSKSLHGVEDEESILEAAERAEREELEAEAEALGLDVTEALTALDIEQARQRQERIAREVSMFAESASAWLQTPAGVWFVPVTVSGVPWLLFLWPEEGGLWTLATCTVSTTQPFANATTLARGMLIDGAKAYAEKLAKEQDPKGVTERSAAWRLKQSPSYARTRTARSLGIKVRSTMTDADVADAIYVKLAERSLGG